MAIIATREGIATRNRRGHVDFHCLLEDTVSPRLLRCTVEGLTRFRGLPYNTYDSVLYGNPVQVRSGPATVSAEERSE